MTNIGFIQGRFSPMVDGKIQCFPWKHWESEFELAYQSNFKLMEWTLDQENLYECPIMNDEGVKRIKELQEKYSISIPSLTGDCFMQAPFYKEYGEKCEKLLKDFQNIIIQSAKVGVKYIVFPLVDNGRLENKQQEDFLVEKLLENNHLLKSKNMMIVFESDYAPKELGELIKRFPKETFGINYDTGNSASLGFDPSEEFNHYGDRIENIHIKDRIYQGTTVPLGQGDTKFADVFKWIKEKSYSGNLILQTARAVDNDHVSAMKKYRQFVIDYMS